MSAKVIIHYFKEELEQLSHPASAVKMAAYMKDNFKFYGVAAPARKELVIRIWHTEKPFISENIRTLIRQLWVKEEREYQMIALDLMGRCKKQFLETDLALLEELITTKSWWDTVDFIASTMVGYVLSKNTMLAKTVAEGYMSDDNMWLKRTALIFQLKYRSDTDEMLLYKLIDATKGSQEFFINKASGWALRQYSKYDRSSVESYLTKNRNSLAKLTIKEGSKYL